MPATPKAKNNLVNTTLSLANSSRMLPMAERPAETSNICTLQPWEDDSLQLILRVRLYLTSRYRFRRNSVTGRVEYAPTCAAAAEPGPDLGDAAFTPLDKAQKHSLQVELAHAGIPYVALSMIDAVTDNAGTQPFDPVQHYLSSLPAWDGTERITAFFRSFTDDAYELSVLHRAFLATVGQMKGCLTFGNEICPIFISRTQGWGKSKSLRRLLPPELQHFFTDTFNLRREEECLRRMNGFVLINLDEIDHYSPASLALLKKLIQMKDLPVRRLYCNWMETLERRASFWGTSNCRYVLNDPSGSRRFFPVMLKGVVDLDSPIDYPQLYAQALHELGAGHRKPWFNPDENVRIEQHNRHFNAQMTLDALLDKHFEVVDYVDKTCSDGTARRLGLLTAQEAYDELNALNPELMSSFCERNFGQRLKQYGCNSLRSTKCRRYNLRLRSTARPVDADNELFPQFAE